MCRAGTGKFRRFKERIIHNTDIICMAAVCSAGECKVPGFSFTYDKGFRLVFLWLICPGSIAYIVSRMAEDQISLTGMNPAEIVPRLQMKVREVSEWK